MIFQKTKLDGVLVIRPSFSQDKRGFFMKPFDSEIYKENGVQIIIDQVNISKTQRKGTIRGMHYQKKPHEEEKIVGCIKGAIYDVIVDLRKGSKTYGKWHAHELTEENKKIIFIPKGFAHGFQTLTNNTEVLYLMSGHYSPDYATGVRWDDPFFDIPWPIRHPFLGEKDKTWQ